MANYPHFPMDLIERSGPLGQVLEVGLGAGFDAERFCALRVRYVGIDKSTAAVAVAKERVKACNSAAAILRADFWELALPAPPDLIFDRGVFHNQRSEADRESFAAKCAQLLSPRGHWISVIGCADSRVESPHGSLYLSNVIPLVERYFEILAVDRRRYGPDDWPDNFDAWYCLFVKRTPR